MLLPIYVQSILALLAKRPRTLLWRLPLLLCALTFLASFAFLPDFALAQKASSPAQLKKEIEAERKKVEERKKNINKLTDLERNLNENLARAEDRIEKLQASITKQEAELTKLEAAQGINRRQYDELISSRSKTEADIAELLRFLWPVYVAQESTGARDGLAWAEAERDYLWTAEIMRQIALRQTRLKEQESAISDSLTRHESLAVQLRAQLEEINADKDKLLADKLKFAQNLSSTRKEIKDAEAEINSVLSTIQSLNIRLEKASIPPNDIPPPPPPAKSDDEPVVASSGKMPWPASGRVVAKYSPKGSPPVNGIGLALNEGDVVKAVAWGKVVHNDVLRGLGRVVVLMHDKGYYTVYAYLAESNLKIGQQIKQGQVLGKAGYYPPAKGTGTYFEVRLHQKPINPASWLAKR